MILELFFHSRVVMGKSRVDHGFDKTLGLVFDDLMCFFREASESSDSLGLVACAVALAAAAFTFGLHAGRICWAWESLCEIDGSEHLRPIQKLSYWRYWEPMGTWEGFRWIQYTLAMAICQSGRGRHALTERLLSEMWASYEYTRYGYHMLPSVVPMLCQLSHFSDGWLEKIWATSESVTFMVTNWNWAVY